MKPGVYGAAAQMDCVTGGVMENARHICRMLTEMKAQEPKLALAVFPEMALYGYEALEEIPEWTDAARVSRAMDLIGENCRRLELAAVVGTPWFTENGVENSLCLAERDGRWRHVYSKCHLIRQERKAFRPGTAYTVCSTSAGVLGFLICWDCAFPEAARACAQAGAELLAVSAAWEKCYERQWELAACGRSLDNDIPVIASNRVGRSGSAELAGRSLIGDSMGNIICQASGQQEGWVTAELSRLCCTEIRRDFGSQPLQRLEEQGMGRRQIGMKEGSI